MSAIQCWPQLFGHPVMCNLICSAKPGSRSSSSVESQRAKPFVSVNASLQNSEPVQATVPRAKAGTSTGNPALLVSAGGFPCGRDEHRTESLLLPQDRVCNR